MALRKSEEKVPKNAIVLKERDAVDYQWRQIFNWPNKLDVWAYRYGLASLAATAAISAGYIIRRHRMKLKLREYGYLTSMTAVMVAPSIAAAMIHIEFVTNDIIIFKTPCPVCLQTRAAAIQLTSGVLYPLIFSPIACSLLALQGGTRIPFYTEKLEVLKMWWRFTKPLFLPLSLMAGIQVIISVGLTYFEMKQIYELQENLLLEVTKRKEHREATK